MFSDRFLWAKFAALVLLFGTLCRHGGNLGEGTDFAELLARPSAHDGRAIVATGLEVVETAPGEFTVDDEGLRLRVLSNAAVRPGDRVELSGTFRRDRTVRADAVTLQPHFVLKRRAMLAGSLATLIAFAAYFLRRRITHFSDGLIEERACPTP